MSKAGRRESRKRAMLRVASDETDAGLDQGKFASGNVAELVSARGFTIVQSQRSGNKFLGSEQPKSKINPNGYDPVQRAAMLAKMQATAALQAVIERHEQTEES